MFNVKITTHCKPLFREASILILQAVYIFKCLEFTKINFNMSDTSVYVHGYCTRTRHNLIIGHYKYSTTTTSFIEQSERFFNLLPLHIRNLNETVKKIYNKLLTRFMSL
jgi:hypothetical protein